MSAFKNNTSDNFTNNNSTVKENNNDIYNAQNLDLEEIHCLNEKKYDISNASVVTNDKPRNDKHSNTNPNLEKEMDFENSEDSDPSISSITPDSPSYVNGLNPVEANDAENDVGISYLKCLSKDETDDGLSSPLPNGFSHNIRQECNGEYIEKRKLQRPNSYTQNQRNVLLKYFDDLRMNSTHRKNTQLIDQCAKELEIPVAKIKNWIGAEAVRRKKKLGLLPKSKVYQNSLNEATFNRLMITPSKVAKRQRSASTPRPITPYQFIYASDNHKDLSLAGHSAAVTKLSTSSQQSNNFHSILSNSPQQQINPAIGQIEQDIDDRMFATLSNDISNKIQNAQIIHSTQVPLQPQHRFIECKLDIDDSQDILTLIQELYQHLENQGFEGYGVLVNTKQIQTHLVSTHRGLSYHQLQLKNGKPLENPFIGYVFSNNGSEHDTSGISFSPENEHDCSLRKTIEMEFALKYKDATGRTSIPYDNPLQLEAVISGLPPSIPFISPNLYTQSQLEQIAKSLSNIEFIKTPIQDFLLNNIIIDTSNKHVADSNAPLDMIQAIPASILQNGNIVQPIND